MQRDFGFNRTAAAQSGVWTQQTSGTTSTLWSVHFISETVGWAAGDDATLLRTSNGGANWTPVSNCLTSPDGFFSVRMLNPSLVWAGGDLSVARTENGGTGFDCETLDPNAFHNTYFPTSSGLIWSAGLYSQPSPPFQSCQFVSRISYSSGAFAEEVFTECPGVSLFDLYFVNSGNGWAVGEQGRIVRITNTTATPPSITAQSSGTTEVLWGVFMLDVNTGWAVGNDGTILKTTNGGTSWSPQSSGTSESLRDVHFVDATRGWVVGANGIILVTVNGGAVWAQENSGVSVELENLVFPSANVGYAVGENGRILKRTVGGCSAVTVNPSALASGAAGEVYPATTFTGTGGAAPYTFVLTGALPAGMTFAGGTLSGTPAQTGSFPITVTATDGFNCMGSRNYTLAINCGAIVVGPASLPAGTTGAAYSQSLTQTGGVGPVSFSLDSGTLPGGLTISSSGLLSGTPAQCGTFNFVVKATDANNCMGTRSFALTVNGPAIAVNPPALPAGTVGAPYNQTITASGGSAPYSFSVISGSLPPGLALSAGGALAGTPSSQGTFNFTVTAADANGCTGSRAYTLSIAPGALAGLQYYPLPFPVRLLDTRPGESACFVPGVPLGNDAVRAQPAVGSCGGATIPAGARAIAGNATVVNFISSGFHWITLYPSDAAQPNASNLNFSDNQIVPNQFTVGLGADGAFKIYSHASTHFIVDITGYYAPPGAGGLYFHPLPAPARLLDTRPGETACDAPGAPLAQDGTRTVLAHRTCSGATIPAAAKAIVGNATVVNFISSGFHWITLYPFGTSQPNASNLNFTANQIVPNAFIAGLSGDGKFNIYSHASTHFIVDVTGYFSDEAVDANGQGLLYNPLPAPVRLLDTRPGEAGCDAPGAPLGNEATLAQAAHRTCFGLTIPNSAKAVVGNATVVNFISSGFHWITLYPFGAPQPNASNLNFSANQIVPNSFVVGLSGDGKFNIYSHASTHFIVDLTGYFAP
jgi:photosystem II stability/assembly factor-like uncharacterized protein